MLFFQRGAENSRQIADILDDQEVAAHEPLDGVVQIRIGVAEAFCHFGLHVKGKTFLGPQSDRATVPE